MTSTISWAAAPRPLEVDIFLPPMLRNSYGTLSGGSRSKTSRAIASDRSRDPPAVERSLPQGSIVTPNSDHWAAHSRFQGSFARPPNGATQPEWPQPRAQSTRCSRHSKNTRSPSHFVTIVVPILPQLSQMTLTGCQSCGVLDVGDPAVDVADGLGSVECGPDEAVHVAGRVDVAHPVVALRAGCRGPGTCR